MSAIRRKVKDIVGTRSDLSRSFNEVVWALNPVLRGWDQYFKVGNSSRQFAIVDEYVYWKLAIFRQRKHQWQCRWWRGPRFPQLLRTVGLHRLTGTARYPTRVHAAR